ncbi:MAG TPA: hypothetical protein VHU44_18665 [Acidobacteriaceae bacterium]|nr:hypothetical protein [Acidobacteriaceae bacterium]
MNRRKFFEVSAGVAPAAALLPSLNAAGQQADTLSQGVAKQLADAGAYIYDHGRRFGAGTFTTKLGSGKIVYQRVPEMHRVLQPRFLANASQWLVS